MSNIDERQLEPENLFDETYYATYLGMAYGRTEHWLTFFGGLAERIKSDLEPATVLDLGCAWGFLVEGFRDRGVDATGHDISSYAISQAGGTAVGHCHERSATDPLEKKYDLIISIEMIEHMSAAEGRTVIEQMTAATDQILLSTTPFHHEEATHFNVQPPEYWARIMAENGFYRDVDYDASYLSQWAALFVRREPRMPELVHWYERSEWRHRMESVMLRQELNRLTSGVPEGVVQEPEERITALEIRARRAEDALAPLQQRLVQADSALNLARDAAAGAEARLGASTASARYQQEQLAAANRHIEEWDNLNSLDDYQGALDTRTELDAVKASTTWRLMWVLLAPYRSLRGRR